MEYSPVPEPPPATPSIAPSDNPAASPTELSAAEPVAPSAPLTVLAAEDPAWTIPDVFLLALVTFAALIFSMIVVAFVAQRWYFHSGTFVSVATRPMVAIAAQALAYVLFFAVIFVFIRWERRRPFLAAVSWNWPRERYWGFLGLGVVLSFSLELLLRLLPVPKSLPVTELFKTPMQAFLLSIFSVSLGPLFEEFFFRGFLYPALARRLGRAFSVFLTAILFAAIHAAQLANAWAPVFIIFLVGVVLGTVRAIARSLAASLLVHVAYNSTIAVLLYIGSDGYRHLEKLSQ